MKLQYRFSTFIVRTVFNLFFGVKIHGHENLNFVGPAILVSNHISLCDPPLIGSFLPFEIHFMAKAELFRIPLLKNWIRAHNAFPIRRGGIDRQSLETAARLLKGGARILIFPEGTRQKDGVLAKGHPGPAKVALDNQVPIIPTCIIGSNHLRRLIFSRTRIQICFGERLETAGFEPKLSEKERVRKLANIIMERIKAVQERYASQ